MTSTAIQTQKNVCLQESPGTAEGLKLQYNIVGVVQRLEEPSRGYTPDIRAQGTPTEA